MENNQLKFDFWHTIYFATFVVLMIATSKIINDIGWFKINRIILSAVFGALGGMLGYGLYFLVKKQKMWLKLFVYLFTVALILCGLFLFVKLTSDDSLVKKNWTKYDYGKLSFEYPKKMEELKGMDSYENVRSARAFQSQEKDRLVINMIFDFKSDKPEPIDSLSGSIINSVNSIKATNFEWIDTTQYNNCIDTKFKFTFEKKEKLGYGIIYFEGDHYELLICVPYKKSFSEQYLNKIIKSISIIE